MAIDIGRRQFISAIGGATVAWPLAARAQQAERVRRVGVLMGGSPNDPDFQSNTRAFEDALRDLGWTSGRNILIDYRWISGDAALARTLASELLGMSPDVVLTVGLAPIVALHDATHTVPVVFARVSDPVGLGIVASLARPGGNVTGFINFEPAIAGKWLQTLKEIAPGTIRVAVIANPEVSAFDSFFHSITSVAGALAVEPVQAPVRNRDDIERAIAAANDMPGGGLIVLPDGFIIGNRATIIAQAAKNRLPAIYPFRFFASDGGLVSYGINTNEQLRGAASYIDRILKGEKAADLPVQAPTKYELVINLKTAKALGLSIPQTLIATADEVIE
jgi:putative ABC transport system substrate-binding protein